MTLLRISSLFLFSTFFALTLFAQETSTGWVKYENNPVFGGAELGTCFDVTMLQEDGKYKMWFSWRPKKSLAYTESKDGINWSEPTIVLAPNPDSGWENEINRPSVIKRDGVYHLWYTGQVWYSDWAKSRSWIGYATSTDGIHFERKSDKPVLVPEKGWEKEHAVMCPNVEWDADAKLFTMWYSGGEIYEPNAIGYATSPDGLVWTKYKNNPIFSCDKNTEWEHHKVAGGHVFKHNDWYLMFYIGYENDHLARIGIARSKDGITNWERLPTNPIISPTKDGWDAEACYKPFVIYDAKEKKWRLWYNGRTEKLERIGLVFHDGEDLGFPANDTVKDSGYPINPVPFTSVKVTDQFWGQRLAASREVTIPLAFSKCEETGRYENFHKAAHPSPDYKVGGFSFDDTDVYKTIEGASYSMQTWPDEKLAQHIDSLLTIVAAAQEPDGYLFTARTMNPQHPHDWVGHERWEKVEEYSHEFYNLGHLLEAAIAHYQATGKRNFLDIAIRYADCVERSIGDKPGQVARVPGHQIAEMGLAKLYTITGEKKYLDLAKYFLDKRGYTARKGDAFTRQMHKPILEQDEAVGHAVRAVYMYSGIADVAALTGDTAYIHAIDRLWDNVVSKKLYITGGIGARHQHESFGDNYELPNLTAYNETCAAIANVYWNYRLFLLHGDAKYFDVLERTLYNGLISGVSLDGATFFYPNPLESDSKFKFNRGSTLVRQPWFDSSCCPSNVSRFIPSLPGYVYAVKNNDLYVNLFMGNDALLEVEGKKVAVSQSTDYPWNGDVKINISPRSKQTFTVKVRVPGWVQGQPVPSDLYTFADDKQLSCTVKVNGDPVESVLDKGYFSISRQWKKDDVIEVHFDMEPRIVKAHKNVEADRNKISIERGPIVYCAEWADNDFNIFNVLLNRKPEITVENKPNLLSGIHQLKMTAQLLSYDETGRLQVKDVTLSLIPYYAWNHRGSGNMAVWLLQNLNGLNR